MSPWIAIGLSGAAFLAAAKAHGRQIRLERELAGFWRVVFGGRNPPFVTALWRRDRILLWSAAAAALALMGAFVFTATRWNWRLPLTDGIDRVYWWGFLPLGVAWPITAGFFVAGIAGLIRTVKAYYTGDSQVREWFLRAFWGSIGWWSLAICTLAASLLLSWHRGL